ncbi:MAG: ABC transporter substrate-binding protein, partial [Clostridia bacterium]|nr:ABC transporter substrate-binding protein [Clostridia bacterium]
MAGCSEKTEENDETSDGMKATLKFAFPGDAPAALDEVVAALETKLAEDGLDFELEFSFFPWDQYWNKIALIAAGGEEYDITWTHSSQLGGLVNKKALQPLNESLEKYGEALTANTPEHVFEEVTFDGDVYAIPRVMPMAESTHFLRIRGDLRKKYGVPEIKTIEDLEQYFEAIKTNEPDMHVYYGDSGYFMLRELGNYILPIGDWFQHPVFIDPTDPDLQVGNFFETQTFKDVMFKLRDWRVKGYIPAEGSIPDIEGAFNEGKLAATWSVIMKVTESIDSFKMAQPEGEVENVFLHKDQPIYRAASADNMLSVFSTSKQVDEAVAFINWFRSSQENYDLWSYGIEGTNYILDGESISYEGIDSEHSYMPINWAWNDIRFHRFSKHISEEYVEELRNWDENAINSPLIGFSVDKSSFKTEMAQINAVLGEYVSHTVLYAPDVDWEPVHEAFLKNLKAAGLDKLAYEVQNQVDDFKNRPRTAVEPEPIPVADEKTTVVDGNIAVIANVVADTVHPDFIETSINDNKIDTAYVSENGAGLPQTLTYTWEEAQEFNTVKIAGNYPHAQGITTFDIQVSKDGVNDWETVYSVVGHEWEETEE